MVDAKHAPVRTIEEKLGMTYRTYLLRREQPTDLSLAEIYRLAYWMGEPVERIAAELMAHTYNDPLVIREPRKRHPNGIKRKKNVEEESGPPSEDAK